MSSNYILRRKFFGENLEIAEQASTTGLRVFTSGDLLPEDGGLCFRWGCTATIPGGTKVINTADAIHGVFDKRGFRAKMAAVDLSPKCWTDFGEFLDNWGCTHPFEDAIVRPANHTRSENLHYCRSFREVYDAIKQCKDYYISEYIKKDSEYRVFFCQGRILGVIRKIPVDPDAVSWGCVEQGDFKYVDWSEWPLEATQMALDAAKLSGLQFGAVDLICDFTRPYVLEINTAPGLGALGYWVKQFTKAFDYIVENGKDDIPVSGSTWRHLVHPALSTGAI